jgi:hypothetical protein
VALFESGRRAIRRTPESAVVLVLLATFTLTAWLSLRGDAPTVDEPTHLMAGFSYLDKGDFRLNPEHPPLAKMWAALPLALGDVESISATSVRWRLGRQRELGYEFVNGSFEDLHRRDPSERLVPARTAMMVLGIALGLIVYAWARELWGRAGAVTALALYAFSPTILAHARLVTTDIPAALGFTTTLWSFWRFCRQPRWPRALVTGAAIGMALLVKFSTILLAPMLGALLVLWIATPQPSGLPWPRRAIVGCAALAAAAAVAVAIVWAGYGFRYRATVTDEYSLPWHQVTGGTGAVSGAIDIVRSGRALPESYLYGLAYVVSRSDRRAFLNGEIRDHGTWLYFPEAFALKSTPALLVIVAWLAAASMRRWTWSFDGWFLAIPAIFYMAVSMVSGLNIGHRHLLPIYPLLFVAAGWLGRQATRRRAIAFALAALLASHALSSLSCHPLYLSYFNALAGGPRNGWRHLVDSNIDWGQDLGRLARWMRENGVPQVMLAYFGAGDPGGYGITFRKVCLVEDFEPGVRHRKPMAGDYLAASVTLLQGLYVTDPATADWLARVRDGLEPTARAGDSILIYHLPPSHAFD